MLHNTGDCMWHVSGMVASCYYTPSESVVEPFTYADDVLKSCLYLKFSFTISLPYETIILSFNVVCIIIYHIFVKIG